MTFTQPTPEPMELLLRGPQEWNAWMLMPGRKNLGSLRLNAEESSIDTLKDYEFINCDIDVLLLESIKIQNCQIRGCQIRRLEASAVTFAHSLMTETSISELVLAHTAIKELTCESSVYVKRASINAVKIENCDLRGMQIGALTGKNILRVNLTRMNLELAEDSMLAEVQMKDSTLTLKPDFPTLRISKVILDNVSIDNCRLKVALKKTEVLSSVIRDSHLMLVDTVEGQIVGSAVIRSTLHGVNLERLKLGNTVFIDAALPKLRVPDTSNRGRSIHDILLPEVPNWIPTHPVRDITGIGEKERQVLAELQARLRIWQDIRKGGIGGRAIWMWAVLSGFGRSFIRLALTTMAVLVIGALLLMIPQFQISQLVLCPDTNVDANKCVEQVIRHLQPHEALLESIALALTLPARAVPIDWLGSIVIVLVGLLGILNLSLLFSVVVYYMVRVSSE